MAKVKIMGGNYIIMSSIAAETLQRVKRFRPSALELVDPEMGTVFKIDPDGPSNVSNHGICFGSVTNDDAKLATTAALPVPEGDGDVKERVLDVVGMVITMLNKVEAQITPALQEIQNERTAAAGSIEIVV